MQLPTRYDDGMPKLLFLCFLVVPGLVLPLSDDKLSDTPGLHNVIRVTPKLLSGSSPKGEQGFQALQKLGVQTIISVDGAKPDLPLAKKFGLRYVHLPIGYDSVPTEQGQKLAKAVKDLPGLIYMHCHHGKHRSPAAAAVVKLHLDETCSNQQALALLKAAGTDPHYLGLYAASRDFERKPIDWMKISSDYPETAQTGTLVQEMCSIDNHWERLKLTQKAHWQPTKEHPDIDPAHEALMLWERYVELRRLPEMKKKPADFQAMLLDGETAAKQLESSLRLATTRERNARVAQHFKSSQTACTKCHAHYRDVPQAK
jgi:protein tyrosine phosphatase (PTP) superfamily phosphohydrolase (DUF442 family)